MFRGIVEGTASVARRAPAPSGERLELEIPKLAAELTIGQSVAIDGACLTVAAIAGSRVSFDLAGETLRRTSLGERQPGDVVNVERAMRLEDRIDGHLVQGHVDGTGSVRSFERRGDDRWLVVAAPRELLAQMVQQGSVALDGVSLTIAELGADQLACTIVPHTFAITNLATRRAGQRVADRRRVRRADKWVARLTRQSGC